MNQLAQANGSISTQITESIQHSMIELWTKVGGFIPNLVGTLVILIVGNIISKLLQWIGVAVLKRVRFDTASEKTGLSEAMQKVGIRRSASVCAWLSAMTLPPIGEGVAANARTPGIWSSSACSRCIKARCGMSRSLRGIIVTNAMPVLT